MESKIIENLQSQIRFLYFQHYQCIIKINVSRTTIQRLFVRPYYWYSYTLVSRMYMYPSVSTT